jgi:D-arabinose 5-phosphate isomerase GutQ
MTTRSAPDSMNRPGMESSGITSNCEPHIAGREQLIPSCTDSLNQCLPDERPVKLRQTTKPAPTGKKRTAAVKSFLDLALEEIIALRGRIEEISIEQAADLILESESHGGRVHVTGIGKSEHVARYFASLLSSTGTPAYFLDATECLHGSAGQVRREDITIAISNSGATPELMCAIEALRNLGIKIIGLSSERQSPLGQCADVLLYAGVNNEGGDLNLVPRTSILAKIYVLCALSVSLESHKGLTREQYALWHPNGALGRLARGE